MELITAYVRIKACRRAYAKLQIGEGMSQTVIVFSEDCILAAAGREGRYPVITKAERVRCQGQGDFFERWQQALMSLSAQWKSEPALLVLPVNMCSARVSRLPCSRGKAAGSSGGQGGCGQLQKRDCRLFGDLCGEKGQRGYLCRRRGQRAAEAL